ncbi:MAG: clostripain-related cysteine peptidase [Elusimicrobiaceae bacterium]|nr:clostripain-related cysteine peptidase [Elusimicrobiaceae bacterium]
MSLLPALMLGSAAFLCAEEPVGGKAVRPEKDWTVMFYFNGKNDLEVAALTDFNSLEQIGGSTDRVNFVAELGRSVKYDTGDGDWSGVRRYLIGKGADPDKIETASLQTFPADMGDWKHLASFILWCKSEFPARHYALVMWDHGTGWKDANIDDYFDHLKDLHGRGISIDVDSGHYIRTGDLGRIFAAAGGVDLYAIDACLMQLASVLYQTGTGPDLILASEDIEPADGFDYAASFGALRQRPSMSGSELAAVIIADYRNYFEPAQQPVTLSAVRTGYRDELIANVNNLADTVMRNELRADVKTLIALTLAFYDPDYRDLYDFAVRLAEGNAVRSGETKARARELMRFIKDKYVAANGTVSEDFKRAGGVSVYLPRDTYSADYEKLDFARDSRWDEFLKWVLEK